ncbi:MAG: hypothetical protein MPJ50_03650 [Pirellulales bacterium]|nr:hypothetical protein [Pirellulales bacterium]
MQNDLWYAIPLILSVSLVYAATRHEDMNLIWRHAIRAGLWITGLMTLILAVLFVVTMYLV